ncbi:serine/threonine protein phosphatase [Mesorhizobium sp. CGMCC 1.15528]|uniref:Serine/threonine protein phosphatase n=1 Tax=Mesorhizobium zhangyense TaxID=1776730 RepID=A0A7C9VD66_9HYPH|nr:serine/threonine protein phosphatase [Mesorhizobium zhangyense]NGN42030.1 serine/threonine protein phosphatase [Mesorhizobium zhangyense]
MKAAYLERLTTQISCGKAGPILSKRSPDTMMQADPAMLSAVARIAEAPKPPRLHVTAIRGQRIWFKHFGAERTAWGKRLHALVSPLMYPRFTRASLSATPEGKAARELRKIKAFRGAGFRAPEVFYQRGDVLALSDMGETMQTQMRHLRKIGDVTAHDELLVHAAEALGQVHEAGLCHGRPHPRDFVVDDDGRFGFLDFEEEPEATMPLADAQARDVWLLFFQITYRARQPETATRALKAYKASAPKPTLEALARLLHFFRVFIPLGRVAAKFHLGGDLERFMRAMDFFRDAEGDAAEKR